MTISSNPQIPPMAKKKSNPNNNTSITITTTHSKRTKPHSKSRRHLSPDNQMDNLKSLNHLLLQETMEKRSQIDTLKVQVDTQSFAFSLEQEFSFLVLSCSIAERERKVRSLLGKFDEMRRVLDGVVGERDLLRNEVELRRRENGEIRERLGRVVVERDEMERKGMKREEAYKSMVVFLEDVKKEREEVSRKHEEEIEVLRSELDGKDGKIAALEDEVRRALEGRKGLEEEVKGLKDALGLVKGEEEGLRVRVGELVKVNEEARKEIGRMRRSIVVLEKEKELNKEVRVKQDAEILELKKEVEEKKVLEVKIAELGLKLDEMKEKMGEAAIEKDDVEKLRAQLEVEIVELKKEVGRLHLDVLVLEEKCRDYGVKKTQLQNERDGLMRQCGDWEKKLVEKEKEFAVKVQEISRKMDDLVAKMGEILAEKDEAENVKAKQEVEIIELKKEVGKLGSNASELHGLCKTLGEKNTQLENERDAVKRELTLHKKEASELQLQVEQLMKHSDESLEEIKKLSASVEALLSEKEEGKMQIKTLIEEKDSLEKKMRKANMVSDKALALLKRTTEALNEPEKAHENGNADHEEIQPFVDALEGIKGIFRSRATTIEEMSREVERLKEELIEVRNRNKNRGLFMWLYPATTTALAAFSLAYTSRSR